MNQLQTKLPKNDRSVTHWLIPLLMRKPNLAQHIVVARGRLAVLPRPWRTRLFRRLGLSVASTTLLLALTGAALRPAVHAMPSAVIVVANGTVGIASDNKCSLVEAINNANDTATGRPHPDCAAGSKTGVDTVQLPTNGNFSLNAVVHTGPYGNSGLPLIKSAIVIAGNGSTIERAAGSPEFRFFEVASSGGDLTLQGVTLRGGSAPDEYGGAIYTLNKLKIVNSTLSNNSAAYGGAIYGYYGDVTIESSTFSGNTGELTAGAIGLFDGSLAVTGTSFASNYTTGEGGAIFASYAPVNINNSTFTGNEAYWGAGVYVYSGNLTINGGSFTGGQAYAAGGAIYASGYTYENACDVQQKVVLRDVTISDNTANAASAMSVKNAVLTVDRTTISGNQSTLQQGAIYLYSSKTTMSNSTISANRGVLGGGMYIENCETSLINVTVTGNTATSTGGGIYAYPDPDTILKFTRSIVSGNTANTSAQVFADGATVTANSFNLFGSSGQSGLVGFGPGATDIVPSVAISAILQPLGSNGGSTKTHALLAGSPAIDVATTTACNAAPISGKDQRGVARGSDGNGAASANECDAGAFEFIAVAMPDITKFSPAKALVGKSVTITGKNFTGATTVSFNGTPATTFSVKSDTQITAVVPPKATTGKISVTTPSGTDASPTDFIVIPAKPTVTSISPKSGPVGTMVTIVGTNFTSNSVVKFSTTTATDRTVVSSEMIVARVPAGTKTGVVSVITLGGTAKSKDKFTVTK